MKQPGAEDKLINAFFCLLEKTHYTKISVTDLVEKAGCSRTTFYRNYSDVLDMYDKICEKITRELLKELYLSFVTENNSLADMFDVFCEKLESQKYYITLLCGKNGSRRFFETALNEADKMVVEMKISPTEKEKFTMKFGILSIIGTYVKSLMDETEFDKKFLIMYRGVIDYVVSERW